MLSWKKVGDDNFKRLAIPGECLTRESSFCPSLNTSKKKSSAATSEKNFSLDNSSLSLDSGFNCDEMKMQEVPILTF